MLVCSLDTRPTGCQQGSGRQFVAQTPQQETRQLNKVLRVIVALPGVLFVLIGLRWLFAPAGVAAEFGMPVLDGLGLSTQVGDLSAFFRGGGVMMLLGAVTQRDTWLLAPAMLLALAALGRLVSWQLHGAAFAAPQLAVEVVLTCLLLFAASKSRSVPGGS
jgi:hypothetical protein